MVLVSCLASAVPNSEGSAKEFQKKEERRTKDQHDETPMGKGRAEPPQKGGWGSFL